MFAARTADVLQISAVTATDTFFSRFGYIAQHATNANRFRVKDGLLYYCSEPVKSVTLDQALLDFLDFLVQIKEPVLVGHNLTFDNLTFDMPIFCNALHNCGLKAAFQNVVPCCIDSMVILKDCCEGVKNYKLSTMVNHFTETSFDFHNVLEDVKSLKLLFEIKCGNIDLNSYIFPFNYTQLQKSYQPMVSSNSITLMTANKLSKSGLSCSNLENAY